jgi:hypothetical protein
MFCDQTKYQRKIHNNPDCDATASAALFARPAAADSPARPGARAWPPQRSRGLAVELVHELGRGDRAGRGDLRVFATPRRIGYGINRYNAIDSSRCCARTGGNVSAVVRAFGKAPVQVRRWCKRFSLDVSAFRDGGGRAPRAKSARWIGRGRDGSVKAWTTGTASSRLPRS